MTTAHMATNCLRCDDNTASVIRRLRHVLQHVELNRERQEGLADVLDRFAELEERRLWRRQLAEARDCRGRIAGMVTRLAELDDLTEGERDRTVFKELELLFLAVADDAAEAAAALSRIRR